MRTRPAARTLLIAIAAVIGCGPGAATSGDSSGTTTVGPATTSTGEITTTAGMAGTSTGTTIGDESGTTLDPLVPDLGVPGSCDPYNPDCPAGEKCSIDFTARFWRARCVPITDDPAPFDEPCTVNGAPGSGLDDCDSGLVCTDVDKQGHGQCWAFCQGTPPDQTCPEGTECLITADAYFNICHRPCDPLLQDCPAPGNVCIAEGMFDPGPNEQFLCRRQNFDDGHTGHLDAQCNHAAQCGPGLLCLLGELSPDCPDDETCCGSVCATDAPNQCPGQGQECVAWFAEGTAPPGQDNVGVCAIPP